MSFELSCIICDDEFYGRQNIKSALESFSNWKIVAELDSGSHLVEQIEKHKPDVIFLDIQMPGKSGIELMEEIFSLTDIPEVIFVTAHDAHIIQAFELFALDYILKPFDTARFAISVKRAEVEVKKKNEGTKLSRSGTDQNYLSRLFIPTSSRVDIVDINSVYAFEGNGNYVDLIMENRRLLHRVSMKYLEEHLDPNIFVRCHRSTIVQVDAISKLIHLGGTRYNIELLNAETVSLSQSSKDVIQTRLKNETPQY